MSEAGDELAIVVVWHSAVCPVIALRGELGAATLADLVREVVRVLAERPAAVVVDLTRLASCGFEGMGALISARRRARQLGGELVLAGPAPMWPSRPPTSRPSPARCPGW